MTQHSAAVLLFLCPQSTQVLTDLVYRVHTSQLPLVQSTLELMAFCATGTKEIHTPSLDYIWLTIDVPKVCMHRDNYSK